MDANEREYPIFYFLKIFPNNNNILVLKIWGRTRKCFREFSIAVSEPILLWQIHDVKLSDEEVI